MKIIVICLIFAPVECKKNAPVYLVPKDCGRMMKNATFLLSFFTLILYLSIKEISGEIECHSCGIRKLCSLPYNEEFAEKLTCKTACMKFDGNAEDGKRVLVRTCGLEDTNACNKTTEWHGAKGETCICNAANCNKANSNYFTLNEIVHNITMTLLIGWLIKNKQMRAY